MGSTDEVLHNFSPLFQVYKDGRINRFGGTIVVPASVDPTTGINSKDVKIDANTGLSARLYVPKSVNSDQKLPLLMYFHGGGFVIETAFSPAYHTHLNFLAAEANIIIVSVDYRRAPEHPLPIAYEDSWAAVRWVVSHSSEKGQDPWLNEYADFQTLFFAGDSAGANLAHNMAIRVGSENPDWLTGVNLDGVILVHSYFWGKEPVDGENVNQESRAYAEKLWMFANPGSTGIDDPLINPGSDPRLSKLGCKRVVYFVAENDGLKHRGWYYKEILEKSGWGGEIEVVETKGEGHVFHLFNPNGENAVSFVKSVASFINQGNKI